MKISFSVLLLCSSMVAMAQRGIIKGKVTAREDNGALTGATVQITGTSNGAATNLNGEYQFYANAGNTSLTVRYLGYRDTVINVNVQANQLTVLNIVMRSRQETLQNVIITGYTQGQAKALNQ
ncbi:MAG: carboxypeptidase-like regulatory domain-containing protein, partial [Flavobacterium sp.]